GVPGRKRPLFPRSPARRGSRRGARMRAIRNRCRSAPLRADERLLRGHRDLRGSAPRALPAPRPRLFRRGNGESEGGRASRGRGENCCGASTPGGGPLAVRIRLPFMAGKSKSDKPVAQYLARHAEPEASVADKLSGDFGQVLVVPSYGELETLFALLGSVPGGPAGPVLLIVVLNARSDSPKPVHEANEAVRERLGRELPSRVPLSDTPSITAHAMPGGTLLLIDRALPDHFLPEKQGVGLARKIGNDLALALHAGGRGAAPGIWNRDGAVLPPRDYFEQMAAIDSQRRSAGIYFFEHRFDADPTLAEAARLYEISLRYYVLGLAWAGSPYAYESMGS